MVPVHFSLQADDAASLIGFIDHFLPMVNTEDSDSKDVAANVYRVRTELHDTMDSMGLGDDLLRTDPPA